MIYDVIILGGGAAGLFCGANVELKNKKGIIIDGSKELGIKLMAAGSGQCNFTHGGDIRDFVDKYGDNGGKIRSILYKFNNKMTREFFEKEGIVTIEREDGKVFPKSMKGRDIRDVLVKKAKDNGFEIVTETKIVDVKATNKNGQGYILKAQKSGKHSEATYITRKLVIATGGMSYPNTGSDGKIFTAIKDLGISIKKPEPALTPVFVEDYGYGKISGISLKGKVIIESPKKEKTGDMLFTHKNLSGPVIIDMSRYMKPGSRFSIDYLPEKELCLKTDGEKRSIGNLITEVTGLPKAFVEAAIARALKDIDSAQVKASALPKGHIRKIEELIKGEVFTVSGKGGYQIAMATSGGILLSEIKTATMESKKYPGLYFIGEVLDIDGDTGGYNIQFAFSSGQIAARHISQLP